MNPNKIVLLSLLLFAAAQTTLVAQCNIQTTRVEQMTLHTSGFERIVFQEGVSDNGDLTEGHLQVFVRFLVINKQTDALAMEVISEGNGGLKVIPRQIAITSASGSTIRVTSDNVRVINDMNAYSFTLTSSNISFLKQPIVGFQVIDTRTQKKGKSKTVYDRLLAEQLVCLEKAVAK